MYKLNFVHLEKNVSKQVICVKQENNVKIIFKLWTVGMKNHNFVILILINKFVQELQHILHVNKYLEKILVIMLFVHGKMDNV